MGQGESPQAIVSLLAVETRPRRGDHVPPAIPQEQHRRDRRTGVAGKHQGKANRADGYQKKNCDENSQSDHRTPRESKPMASGNFRAPYTEY